MTNRRLLHIWRNLSFWKRLLLECALALVVIVPIGLLFRFNIWYLTSEALSLGAFYAFIDHIYFAPVKRRSRHRTPEHH
jgi:hypothetical protein